MVHPQEGISYSGAAFTQLADALDGTYTMQIQTTNDYGVVFSILWWGGDLQDLREPSYDPGNSSTPASFLFPPTESFDKLGNPVYTPFFTDALGIQIINIGNGTWTLVVWSSTFQSQPTFHTFLLNFDPSANLNEYSITLQTGLVNGAGTQGQLTINSVRVATFFQFPAIQQAYFGFDVYPWDFSTISNPVLTVALLSLPTASNLLCKVCARTSKHVVRIFL
jgi:hypothetical protein